MITNEFLFTFINTLILLQWRQCYFLMIDPIGTRAKMVTDTVKRDHIVIIAILLVMTTYSFIVVEC